MAPFLVKHPTLIHWWIAARETALARVRQLKAATPQTIAGFDEALKRAQRLVAVWTVDEPTQAARIKMLARDLEALQRHAQSLHLSSQDMPWDTRWQWSDANLSVEGQEMTLALLLEPHGDLVDDLTDTMTADEDATFPINGTQTCATLRHLLASHAQWALPLDLSNPAAQSRFWYVSEEKLEPRLGERFEEPGADLELPLATARDLKALADLLATMQDQLLVAELLLMHPGHRHTVRRLQQTAICPYGDIRDNLIDRAMRPIDLLRLKLAFFGASRFDPRSDRWLRITLFRDEPFPDAFMPIAKTSAA